MVNLPVVGQTSVRSLGGIAVFALTFFWWWTPLAPIGVTAQADPDVIAQLGEEIVSSVLVVPNGRIAVVAPPIVPPRA